MNNVTNMLAVLVDLGGGQEDHGPPLTLLRITFLAPLALNKINFSQFVLITFLGILFL